MSALARYFLAGGFEIGGYDKTRTSYIEHLLMKAVIIHLMIILRLIRPHFKEQ